MSDSSSSSSAFPPRREYDGARFDEAHVAGDPIDQFRGWFEQAASIGIFEPTAMTLATADGSGRPSARIVLMKRFDERGFVFYTNYESRKGRELSANPRASLLFHWAELFRQVRIDGGVTKVSREETAAYFQTRPRESQLGAWASKQSEVIESRAALDAKIDELAQRFPEGGPIEPPPNWGGYRVAPEEIEFWQGRLGRVHDRIRYRREGERWVIERLSP